MEDGISMKKLKNDKLLLAGVMLVGVMVNVSFAYLSYSTDFFLYLDIIGTVTTAYFAGSLPALIVAVASSVISSSFDKKDVYFTFISMIIVFVCDYYFMTGKYKTKRGKFNLLIILSFIGAGFGGVTELILNGKPQTGIYFEASDYLRKFSGQNFYICFFVVSLIFNIVDKTIALVLVYIAIAVLPSSSLVKLRNLAWKQNPKALSGGKDDSIYGGRLQTRMTVLLTLAAVMITVIMAIISISIYNEYMVRYLSGNGNVAANIAASMRSGRFLSDFAREYMIKVMLIFSSYLILILTTGMWISKYYLVFPINSMAAYASEFTEGKDNQIILEEKVKKIKELDVDTDDELENLYNALCKMAEDSAKLMDDMRHQAKSIDQMQTGLIVTMADLVENRDSDTGYHIQKTADYVRIILNGLVKKGYYKNKITPKYISDVVMSAPLHDIGKISVPDAVLNKPGKLTDEEFEIIKTHTTVGKEIMEKVIKTVQGDSYLKEARNMAAYHHEKWDGSGYPEGLKGEVIPLSARIMAVADVFDALASRRVYKDAMPFDKAMDIIRQDAGKHFDPKCAEVFIEASEEVKMVMKRYQD